MRSLAPRRLTVSAVVPTLEEERTIRECLGTLRDAGVDEIVVVDGGSRDATVARAREVADAVAVLPHAGLFAQLNDGARRASGDVLVFQYADGLFPPRGVDAIVAALDRPSRVGGAFCLRFRSARATFRVIAFGAGVRNRLGFGPFGDQSIFVRAGVFRELGGFRTQAFLADFDLVRRLRRRGKFRLVSACVDSSVRRWEEAGIARTLWNHWRLSAAYLLGTDSSSGRCDLDALRRVR